MGRKRTTPEERVEQQLAEKFPSVIQFSVKVLRPSNEYPYENSVWESELRCPVKGVRPTKAELEAVTTTWVKMMETGVTVSRMANEIGASDG